MENLYENINKMRRLINAKHGVIKPLVNEQDYEYDAMYDEIEDTNVMSTLPPKELETKPLPSKLNPLPSNDLKTNTVENEQSPECLKNAGFIKDSIGGPMTKRYVYEKTYGRTTYQINIGLNNVLSKTLIKISGNNYEECSSWSCDPNGGIGITYSGCKPKKQIFY